jgi:DMSO/TMAO reductase YedYZ heme-binding membrane subunit
VNTVAKILGNKLFALAGLVSIGISLLVVPAFTGGLGANPLEKLLHQSGEIAIWTLGAVLALSPLRALFPRSSIVAALNRHRRVIGVSACIYGLLHFGFHVLYEGGWDGLLRSLSKPFIWFGLTGLSILVALALTSNNWSIRTVGGKIGNCFIALLTSLPRCSSIIRRSPGKAIGRSHDGCCSRL